MSIRIRKGVKEDLPFVHALIQELGVYEKAEHEIETSVEQLEIDGFGSEPLFEFFVAENEEQEIVGMALFYFGYSTWKGKKMYLDDLVVTEQYRRKGVGQLLLDQLVAYALEKNAQQLRWHVLNWNRPAINFYEKIQAELDEDWITCKLPRQRLESYGIDLNPEPVNG